MILRILSLRQSLSKAYLKVKPVREDFDNFKKELQKLLSLINDKESEEHNKNFVRDFLINTFYSNKYVNTKGKTDLAVHLEKSGKSFAGVIIEAKSLANKSDMISEDNLNCKAMHEVILYYLRERTDNKNDEIKNIIITNTYEWYIFKVDQFEKHFYKSSLKEEYEKWRDDKKVSRLNDHFYTEIVKKFLNESVDVIESVHLDLRDYKNLLSKENEKQLIPLFKKFSPPELLKEPFANDSNTLNKQFYSELLHIIGLEEYKEGSKKKIGRKNEDKRDGGSLLENTIRMLKSKDATRNFDDVSLYGNTKDEQLYNIALELNIIWINRVLFLKLLEAQLVNYHRTAKDYKFLDSKTIGQYDDLFELFHEVLAVKTGERNHDLIGKFRNIPYLNSSLFELSELEKKTIDISELKDRFKLPFYPKTVFNKEIKSGGELHALEYLLRFLDAFDFASEGGEEILEERKTIINASVLGLIFEKINGYKEGSFYTPGFITMYMARETLRRAVVQKFSEVKSISYKNYDDLKRNIDTSSAGREEANKIINSLKICDPAVGSGHFLVSCLNEIIAIKADLKVLSYRDGRQVQNYSFEIENDELIITNEETDELFDYHLNPSGKTITALQDLQEALFHEKETIIENCLFGVDINPNSVNICRLRLWIELLKNAYYTRESDYNQLETLPNIDINIKQGNSLISRFKLDTDLKKALKTIKYTIEDYKSFVQGYRTAENKEDKRNFSTFIYDIKKSFRHEISANDPKRKRLNNLAYELHTKFQAERLIDVELSDKDKKKLKAEEKKLQAEIEKRTRELEAEEKGEIYRNAFEWRFEFPEVLDDEGNFVGFDVVIGNPPYGVKFNTINEIYFSNNYSATDDIYTLFIEKGILITNETGCVALIIPMFWLTGENYYATRSYINEKAHIDLGINLPYDIFIDAYIDTGIYLFSKGIDSDTSSVYEFEPKQEIDYSILNAINFSSLKKIDWAGNDELKIIFNPFSRFLTNKLNKFNTKIGDVTDSVRGILAKKEDYSEKKIDKSYEPIFDGKIDRYSMEAGSFKYVKYGSNLEEKPASFDYFIGERLLVRRIINRQFRIMATITDEKFVAKKDIYIFKPNQNKFSIEFLLAILNSALFSFIKTKGSASAKKDDFTQLTLNDIRQLAIPEPDDKTNKKIIELVRKILRLKNQNPGADTTKLEKEIDEMVYKLYGLTEEETKIVEGNS